MNQRKKLEHLCRYITRPAIAHEHLTLNDAGQVVLTLKTPCRDGTTHLIMSPLEFMQRLATLVPRPRLNLIRFYGVLAPNAKLRAEIISDGKKSKPTDANDDVPRSPASVRISWARLLKRVFDIDIEQCPHCGGTLKIIAAIQESSVIAKILDHQIFSGNASEPKTLQDMLSGLQATPATTVVLDAGLATEDNIRWLKDHGYSTWWYHASANVCLMSMRRCCLQNLVHITAVMFLLLQPHYG